MNKTPQPEIGKGSRTMLLRYQVELSVRYPISDSLTDEERYSIIKSLANGKNVPMEFDEQLYNALAFFLKTCKKYHVHSECCLSRKGTKDFAFYHLYFRDEQHLKNFFNTMEWPLETMNN